MRDVRYEIEWSRRSANDRSTNCDVRKRPRTPLTDAVAPRPSVATKPEPMTAGSRVHFEAEPGVLVNGTISGEAAGNFIVEVEGSITIPGVRREQLYLAPAHIHSDACVTDSFVFVSAPLPRAESAGAATSPADMQLASQADQPPNPRVILGLQDMGFDRQLCAEAALCTGNESVEKAARWLVDALDQHELARKTEQQPLPHENRSDGVNRSSPTDQQEPVVPNSVGFVDRLTAALANGLPHSGADEKDDGWEVVSSL